MTLYRLPKSPVFPDPREAEPDGLLAVGGDLSVRRLLLAYGAGIFPWFGDKDPILWWSPPERALLLPGQERVPERSRRTLRRLDYRVTVDAAFETLIARCAQKVRTGQEGTWITPDMQEAYLRLHREGYAHSFETWQGDRLVGGLYGLSLGGVFFGESMVSDAPEASRAAFLALCERCWGWGFHFIDGQLPNDNLTRLGFTTFPREVFLERLRTALGLPTRRGSWTRTPEPQACSVPSPTAEP